MTIHIWQGGAVAVKQVTTIVPGGTIGTETFTLTIGGKDVAYTATGGQTATQVATALYNLLSSTTSPPNPEFREFTFADSGAGTITCTATTAGKPIAMTGAATGSATLTVTDTTAATGPNFIDDVDNWSTQAAIANGDTLEFRSGNISALYGLDSLAANTTLTINVREGYRGKIGLAEFNSDSTVYPEYRQKYLQISGGTVNIDCSTIQRCRIDTGSAAATINVRNTGTREDTNIPSATFIGSNAANVANISRGDVGFAVIHNEAAQLATLRVSYVNNQANDARIYCGAGTTLAAVEKTGGTAEIRCATTTFKQWPSGGTTYLNGSGAHASLTIDGGRVDYNTTGTLTNATLSNDGYLDFDQDPQAKTVGNAISVYGDKFTIRDTKGVCNSGVGPSVTFVRNANFSRFLGPVNKTLTLA